MFKVSKLSIVLLVIISYNFISYSQGNKFVSTKGKIIVGLDGKELNLKGINVGNWLEPEGYMFKFGKAESSRKIFEVFNEIIGPNQAEKFWNNFRENYITENDIKFIKDSGFNSIRVPFDYKLFTGVDFYSHCEQPVADVNSIQP